MKGGGGSGHTQALPFCAPHTSVLLYFSFGLRAFWGNMVKNGTQ